jgi:hypothetical protein
MRKTWQQKFHGAKPAHVAVLDKAYAGVPAGARLLIASPPVVDGYVRAIPPGEVRTVARMRADLAAAHGADATCPTSTAIFLRIVAEIAAEKLRDGRPTAEVTPFWRVVDANSALARKLACGPELIEVRRGLEAA